MDSPWPQVSEKLKEILLAAESERPSEPLGRLETDRTSFFQQNPQFENIILKMRREEEDRSNHHRLFGNTERSGQYFTNSSSTSSSMIRSLGEALSIFKKVPRILTSRADSSDDDEDYISCLSMKNVTTGQTSNDDQRLNNETPKVSSRQDVRYYISEEIEKDFEIIKSEELEQVRQHQAIYSLCCTSMVVGIILIIIFIAYIVFMQYAPPLHSMSYIQFE